MADMSTPLKGVAWTLGFTLYKNDGSVIANPGTYTKKVKIDGGAVADIAASVTEEDTTYGALSLVLSTSEMNGDRIWVQVKDDTAGCVPFTATIYPATLSPVAAILDHAISGHTTGGTVGALLNLITDVDSETDRIKEGGDLDVIIDGIETHVHSIETKIGTPANTGGTASLAAILGNPSNVALAGQIADILTDTGTTLDANVILALKLLRNKVETNPATGVMTVYDDNGSTPLYTANVYEDVAGTIAYDGQAANRRDRLA
jgi:hypothetical protein